MCSFLATASVLVSGEAVRDEDKRNGGGCFFLEMNRCTVCDNESLPDKLPEIVCHDRSRPKQKGRQG